MIDGKINLLNDLGVERRNHDCELQPKRDCGYLYLRKELPPPPQANTAAVLISKKD